MKARALALLLCLHALAPIAAHAQTSLYAVGGLSFWGYTDSNGSNLQTKGNVGDVGGGLFYNFPIQSRVTVGVDGRALVSPGDKGGYLAGAALRVGFVPRHNPLRPFVQIGGGLVHTTYLSTLQSTLYTTTTSRQAVTSGALQLLFGLDIRLSEHLDLRAPEYGAQAGGGHSVNAGAAFLNGGLVYHLRPRS